MGPGNGLNIIRFWNCWGGLVLFSDSLAFFTSIALFFVPKDPLGPDFGPTALSVPSTRIFANSAHLRLL